MWGYPVSFGGGLYTHGAPIYVTQVVANSNQKGNSATGGSGKMGQQNAKQQRLDNAAKTGVFAIQDKQTMSFPEKALQIPSLRTLHIENCGINKVPEELASNAATLQRLKLPRNKIEKLPMCMPSLTALQQIDLSGNKLTVISEIFAEMKKLKELSLARNSIAALPSSIGRLSSLKILDVSTNRLVSLPDSVGKLESLEDLDVGNNRIAALPDDFSSSKRLRRVNAEKNDLTSVPSSLLSETPVDSLKLDGNRISNFEGTPGYEAYAVRNEKRAEKEKDARVGTGDLSAGIGSMSIK